MCRHLVQGEEEGAVQNNIGIAIEMDKLDIIPIFNSELGMS